MPKFDQSRLCPVTMKISELAAQCHIWRSPRNHRCGGLISFIGSYQHGSAGLDDARFIRWTLRQFLELTGVDSLVIDCTKLDYAWGDDLDFPVGDTLPFCVVVQPHQRHAYAYAVGESALRTDLNDELAAMTEIIAAMKSRL